MMGNSFTVRPIISGMPNIRRSLATERTGYAVMIYRSNGVVSMLPNIPSKICGKSACDIYIHFSGNVRTELCYTQEGQIIYARNKRSWIC